MKLWNIVGLFISVVATSQERLPSGAFYQALPDWSITIDVRDLVELVTPARVPKTGQDVCFDANGDPVDCAGTGQDGDIRAGLAWPNPRFTDHGNGTVTDNLTGLMWLKEANAIGTLHPGFDVDVDPGDGAVYWQSALNFVSGINDGSFAAGVTPAGLHTDWRLPNLRELFSLIHHGYCDPALPDTAGTGQWVEDDPFTNLLSQDYWSSNTGTCTSNQAICMNLKDGYFNARYKTHDARFVWAVRGDGSDPAVAAPSPVAKTGQTTSYETGDDGDLEVGAPWPNPRFTAHSDGTVTDNLTGLMWLREANAIGHLHPEFDDEGTAGDGAILWQSALDFVTLVNSGIYHVGVTPAGKYTDWRFPNVAELRSLIDMEHCNVALPNGSGTGQWSYGNVFYGVATGIPSYYWTSSTARCYPAYGMSVYLYSGTMKGNYKSTLYQYVWLVRGGG